MNKSFLVLLASIISISASAISSGGISGKLSKLSVMTYNVENLFDTAHDAGKKDWTYLPLATKQSSKEVQAYCNGLNNDYYKKTCLELDWSDAIVAKKIKNLSKVISLYGNGAGADIVVFEEVENIIALKLLVTKGLADLGYKFITLLEGPDSRGIDVGMISRYPVKSQKIHNLDLAPHSTRTTRPILEVEFEVGNKSVTIFGNHWPSQGNVDETRIVASEVLKKAALASRSDLVIATGDFNTVSDDQLNGIELNILPIFEDVEVKGRIYSNIKALGTHWYRGGWESLDKIFVLKSSLMKNRVRVNYSSYDIIVAPFMVKDLEWTDRDTNTTETSKDVPIRFNSKTGEGFSDHLPVAVEFDL